MGNRPFCYPEPGERGAESCEIGACGANKTVLFRSAMRRLGVQTVAELSRRSGVSGSCMGEILNSKKSTRTRTGKWRKTTLLMCASVGCEPSELFPDDLDREIPAGFVSAFVEQAQLRDDLASQPDPRSVYEAFETEKAISHVLQTLTDREREALTLRFGLSDGHPRTLEKVGSSLNVSRERARQIIAKAIRKSHHPDNLAKLKAAMFGVPNGQREPQ